MAFATLGDQAELDFPNYQLLKHIYTRKTFAFGGNFPCPPGERRLRHPLGKPPPSAVGKE